MNFFKVLGCCSLVVEASCETREKLRTLECFLGKEMLLVLPVPDCEVFLRYYFCMADFSQLSFFEIYNDGVCGFWEKEASSRISAGESLYVGLFGLLGTGVKLIKAFCIRGILYLLNPSNDAVKFYLL